MIITVGILISAYPILLYHLNIIGKTNLILIRVITIILFLSLIHIIYDTFWLPNHIISLLDGTLKWDKSTNIKLIIIYIIGLLLILIEDKDMGDHASILLIKSVTIMSSIYLISSIDFLITIPALELLNITVYLIISINLMKEESLSSSIKYFILSSLASSLIMLSIILLYSKTGSTSYDILNIIIKYNEEEKLIILLILGLSLKLGLAPLHYWSPDLYGNLSYNKATWLIILVKLILIFLLISLPSSFIKVCHTFLIFLGIFSSFIGSIGMFFQFNMYRIISYSSIANLGNLMLCNNNEPLYVMYSVIYMITTLVILISWNYVKYNNLGIYVILTLSLLSLAGCPPLPGFYGKLLVLYNLIELGNYVTALLIVLSSLIATCYYLSIIISINHIKSHTYHLHFYDNLSLYIIISIFTWSILFINLYPLNLIISI